MNAMYHILIFSLILLACSGRTSSTADIPTARIASMPGADSIISKADLTQLYTRAIGDYIKAVYEKDKTVFDTLYFGKHVYGQPDDFPDIELPGRIANTEIRLVSPEIGTKLQQEVRSRTYINLMGWVEEKKAEFVFVTFTHGFEHIFDCHIHYVLNTTQNRYEVAQLRFETFRK